MSKKLKFMAMMFTCILLSINLAWADPTTADLDFGTAAVSETFNSLSTCENKPGNTSSATNQSSLTAYGVFTNGYVGKTTNGGYGIYTAAPPFASKFMKVFGGDGKYVGLCFTRSFSSKGSYDLSFSKTSNGFFGLYAAEGKGELNNKSNNTVYFSWDGTTLKIADGNTSSHSWQTVGTPTTSLIRVTVVYNLSASADSYGDDIDIGAGKAHIYINGDCVMNGSNPKEFTIPQERTPSYFRIYTSSNSGVSVDDINIYDALPDATASSCSNYSFHFGTNGQADWSNAGDYCFVNTETSDGNTGYFYILEDFTMPAKPDFYLGWQGSSSDNAKTKTLGFGTIPFDLQRTKTIGTYSSGNTQGAIGTLRVRSSYNDDNKYIGFIPGGYVLRLGSGESWTSYAFTPASSNYYETVWTTDIMTLTAGILGGNAYVGLKTSDSYVWNSTYSQSNAINGNMGQKSGTDTWGSNLSSANDVGKRGKFRIWADNANKNWNLHFVPYHRIVYHSNYPGGGGPADTYSTDVSVEETKSDIALPSAPTAPTGYTFAGWYDAANGGTKKTGNQTISAGASADPEYYAHWYGITLVVKDEDGTTLSGDGKPTLTRSGLSLTATTAGKYVFKDIQITSGTGTLSSTSSTTPTITAISSDITVTATFYKPIAVTKGTNTGAATFTLSATEVARGGNVTITCAADASHKGNPTITATSGNYSTISVASATSASVNGITGPVTINISYTAKETATVKLHVAGSTSTISGTLYEGDSYTLPSEAAECPDMGLYGWYTTYYEHETTAPSGANFKLPGASATLVAGDNDFYAVYATITPDAANTYTEITSVGQLVTGDYLIGAGSSGGYCMSNYITSSHMAERSMTVSDGVVTNSSYSDLIWHITKSGDNYTFYNAAAEKYLALSTASTPVLQTSAHNFTASYTSSSWLFSSTTVSGYQLAYYVATSYFESSTSKGWNIHLFKRDPSIAGPYTTDPSCTTHSLSTAVTPVSTGTAVAGKTVIGEGKTTTVTATPEEGYAFRYWTISGEGSTMSNTSDGKSTDNPVTVTMGTADATITAHFAERVAITFNVPTGVTKPSNSYTDVALPTPDGFPTGIDDDCWAFAGWTESSYVNSTSAPATLYPAGSMYNGSQESAFTLYAVYSRNKYLAVYNSSLFGDLTDYVITYAGITDHEYALTGVADDNNAVVLDVIDNRHDKVLGGLHYYTIDNPSETAVWTLSGSSGSWVLQNKATGKYLDLSSTSSPMISGSSATMAISGDDMDYTFTKSGNKLVITSSGASVGTGDPTEDEEFWLYKLSSSKYMTTPAEPTYAVTYKVSGQSDIVKNVNACTGITADDIPDAPDDDAIGDCADTFMGWSATELGSADDQDAPDDLFTTYTNAPYLTGDLTLYAVFATAGGGGSSSETLSASEITTNFTSSAVAYGDDEKSWTDGTVTWAGRFNAVASGPYMQLKSDNDVYIKIVAPGKITSVEMKATLTSCSGSGCNVDMDEHANATATISLQTAASGGTTVASGTALNKSITLSQSSGNNSTLYIKVDGSTKIWAPITVTYSSVTYSNYKTSCSCNGNPTVTSSASLKGTFSLSEVGVTVADLSVGSGCEWTDAGFVWSPSTNTTPTVGGTNCTRVQVLTSGTDATFDGTLEGEFEVDATYYYRAYGKNEYESGSYQYSTSVSSFIPRGVTFNSNGGSSVDTKYVASGTPVTAPDDPTKTGYDFSKWQLSGADYNFSSNVTASITLDAVWTAQSYSITYKDQGNVAFSGSHVNTPSAHPTSHTYGAETTLNGATKSGYTFGGWYTNEDCTGDPVTTLGATAFSEDITLYAKWTIKKNYFIDRMHGNWDGEHTEPTTGYNCYVREGAGYTVPDLSDDATGSNSCVTGHAHFVGWVASGNIDTQGGLKSGYTIIKGGTSGTASVDGTIYYAVWAEE